MSTAFPDPVEMIHRGASRVIRTDACVADEEAVVERRLRDQNRDCRK